jgi:hypothetical protein
MRGVRRRLTTVAGFVGVLAVGGSALTFCGVPVPPAPPPPTTTTVKPTTTTKPKPTTTTAPRPTTTTTAPVIVNDPLEELISIGAGDVPAVGPSGQPAISGDGRYVAFRSTASNLVPGGGAAGLYLRDRVAGTTRFISGLGDWPALGADGRFLTYTTGSNIYLLDQTTGTTELISVSTAGDPADGGASESSVSADGRYVAFQSTATNLVSNDVDTVGTPPARDDIFLRDRVLHTTTLVSTTIDGTEGYGAQPSMSSDGRTIAFTGDGAFYPGATWTPYESVYVYDAATGTIRQGSVDAWGNPIYGWQPALSGDGNVVVFLAATSPAVVPDPPTSNAAQVYARDFAAGTTTLVTRVPTGSTFVSADLEPQLPSVSSDGSYVAFECWCQRGSGMGHLGTYRVDRTTGAFDEIDANLAGVVGNKDVTYVRGAQSITGDGSQVVYVSGATNLVPGDTNGVDDVFVTTPL